MPLFDLQDVCIVIGSLATLDLPMVFDLIGIYVLKGPYCTLTTTNWFLQALSVIPRGSWGDVARRFTMIRWATSTHSKSAAPSSPLPHAAAGRHQAPPPPPIHRTCSGHRAEEFPSVLNSSGLLVQADEGVLIPVMDLIRRSTAAYNSRAIFSCESGWSQAPRRQQGPAMASGHAQTVARLRAQHGCAMGCASHSSVRPCAARYLRGGRRPASLRQRCDG
ncbi:protein NSP-INTERACTING KINASE 3-like [Dorcoceras hygrometricum]|uniref:Protein NSP-INTERACTING KINASE 3-like n=1 Tax=Dorcoceras hygrometricum TaxID=472368 RepID=A0A2Z7A4C5_9LAMI|nr:protein NSP-INTERACTING KINASE 3-like [Dorcoceras hygrometricum]